TNFLYLCLCKHRYGLRSSAGGGRAPAIGEFRRHLGSDIAEWLRHPDVDPYTPQTAWSLIQELRCDSALFVFPSPRACCAWALPPSLPAPTPTAAGRRAKR